VSGRHRKPTTSSVNVAKLAVTGAVLSGTSIGLAAVAQAASDSEWDTVASCESSGNWSINTGNGYQGGLQFAPSTWLGYGGGQFASAAHLATKDQQIAIAEKVLAGQGRGAWPVCGRGLSGPTPRDTTTTSVKSQTHAPAPAAPADTPADAPAPAATEGTAAPQDLPIPAPQDAAPAPEGTPTPEGVPVPAPEDALIPAQEGVPAPAPQDVVPAPEGALAPVPQAPPAPAPQDSAPVVPAAPQLEIISISTTTVVPDQVVTVDAGLIGPAPQAPADPAVPPAVPATIVPVPADPAAPAPAAPAVVAAPAAVTAPASDAVPAAPAAPGDPAAPAPVIVAAGQLQDGVSHLPSPQAPPPGTSTDPGQATNPNVSYLKELWHAVQNEQIDRNDLLLALAQRSFTGPIPPGEAAPAPAPAPAG